MSTVYDGAGRLRSTVPTCDRCGANDVDGIARRRLGSATLVLCRECYEDLDDGDG